MAVAHLDTLQQLTDALGNRDTNVINRIANRIAQETGQPAPVSFDAAKAIVGQEVVKAIVANGGGQSEREEAGQKISSANSPEQLKSVIDTYKNADGRTAAWT